jgi:hypothetical protein
MLGLDLVADRLWRGDLVDRALARDALVGAANFARKRDVAHAYAVAAFTWGRGVDG